jgi:hypothetical protein
MEYFMARERDYVPPTARVIPIDRSAGIGNRDNEYAVEQIMFKLMPSAAKNEHVNQLFNLSVPIIADEGLRKKSPGGMVGESTAVAIVRAATTHFVKDARAGKVSVIESLVPPSNSSKLAVWAADRKVTADKLVPLLEPYVRREIETANTEGLSTYQAGAQQIM